MTLEEVYRAYFRDVYFYLRSLGATEGDAEELTQETFFKAMDGRKRYDGQKDVRAWLFTVAKNGYFDLRRRHKRQESGVEHLSSHEPAFERLEDTDSAMTVYRLLHRLKEPYKEVFTLRTLGELSFGESGALFGECDLPGAAWQRLRLFRRGEDGLCHRPDLLVAVFRVDSVRERSALRPVLTGFAAPV